MKLSNQKKWVIDLLIPGLLLLFLTTSCNKKETISPVGDSITSIAKSLNAEIFSGELYSEENKDLLGCATESVFFIIEKIPGVELDFNPEIKMAKILYSRYGLVVADARTNQVWLYSNNDPESKAKFEWIKSQLKQFKIGGEISGITRVKLS